MKVSKIHKSKPVLQCSHDHHEPHERHMKDSLFHAVEAAEKAVVHALRDEVDVLFKDDDHKAILTASNSMSRKSIRKTTGRSDMTTAQNNDRNRFGWGLDQSMEY